MSSTCHVVRNARLLLQSAAQHLVDDPALLTVQVSRLLPFRTRVRVGTTLRALASRVPACGGAAALGAFMAGDEADARQLLEQSEGTRSRLRGEVAILLGHFDMITPESPPMIRARASWMRGDLSSAVATLRDAGQSGTRYARRLASELRLLEPGYRLPVHERLESSRIARVDDEPLRVLHLITNSLPYTQSGYSLRTHRILTALRNEGIDSVALTRTGYPVMVGRPTAPDEDVIDGIRYLRTLPARLPQTQEGRLQAEVARALDLVAQFRPHVIHATTNYYNALVAQAVSAVTGLPWVLEVRGLMEKTWVASHSSPQNRIEALSSEKVRLVAAREGDLAEASDAVVTLSETMRDELARRGADDREISVIPNGVDETLLCDHLSPSEARSKLGIGMEDTFLVGTVSALIEYEGLDILLHAVAHLIADDSAPEALRNRLQVMIAGDGRAAPGLRALADDLGVGDRVIMPGRVSRHAARDWVQAMDVVAVPRLNVEVARTVTPQKPVEAMALGRPVIISDLPALRETIIGVDGELCGLVHAAGSAPALADAIMELGTNPERAKQLVELGRAAAAQKTWPVLVRRYARMYADVVTQEERTRGR